MYALLAVLAVLSIWDYPSRQQEHDRLRRHFVAAVRSGDTATMEETCRKGVKLLPDDPTWQYNLACSLAYFPKRKKEALEALEKSIDLGFRKADAIANDADLKRLAGERRYEELIEYAKEMARRPILLGPLATVDATGVFGQSVTLGEQNLSWDFDIGCFVARLKMARASAGGNTGDLYMNRDKRHSMLDVAAFPGITAVGFDAEGRNRGMDTDYPNTLFPYPVFGNSSRAFTTGPYWRSIPRALMTAESRRMKAMVRFYLSNQTWVFPVNADTPPVGTHGDVFASVAPYWIATAGRSYSDLPYLRGALKASAAFRDDTKRELVRRGLLAPTIQTLLRKSLRGVTNETAYLTARAHPTAFPVNGLDVRRLVGMAAAMTPEQIPPLAPLAVAAVKTKDAPLWPELTYATPFAVAFVLRAKDETRSFVVQSKGAEEYAFVQTHGSGVDVKIDMQRANVAKLTIGLKGLSPTNRVDIAVVARGKGTGWGAPSYVSFSRMDPSAPYSDPALTPLPQPAAEPAAKPAGKAAVKPAAEAK